MQRSRSNGFICCVYLLDNVTEAQDLFLLHLSHSASIVFMSTLAYLQGYDLSWRPIQLGDAVQTIYYHLTDGKDTPYRSQNLSHGKRRARKKLWVISLRGVNEVRTCT